jgi:hypothetical protein
LLAQAIGDAGETARLPEDDYADLGNARRYFGV